jgi:protein ImuB
LHQITRADGPERIENEWWIDSARHRDYYAVEDEQGARYWLFRSGHYSGLQSSRWFLHGFFA